MLSEAFWTTLARSALLCAAVASCQGAGAGAAPGPSTLVFFGDSLTAGYGLQDPASQSYPAQVQRRIDAERLPWVVVNAGLSGETSAGGARRVDWVLQSRIDVFVLALGGNDGLRGLAPEETRANLQSIIDRVRHRYPSVKIVVAGMRMPSSMGSDYTEAFRQVFADLASRNGAYLIPFLLEGVAGRPELNQADGIHPNADGAAQVGSLVWKHLGPLLRTFPKDPETHSP